MSWTDALVLLATAVVTPLTFKITFGYSLFVPFVVLHFFLFCNVFRIRRMPELIWSGLFLCNCCVWILSGSIHPLGIFGTQFIATIVIIAYEIRQPCYHGIFAKQINRSIQKYLNGEI